MKILSINNAFEPSTAVFAEDKKIIFSIMRLPAPDRTNDLLFLINEFLKETSTSIKDIDIFSVVYGPGSFTGTRIGVVDLKIIAHILKKPIVPINSLELIAFDALNIINVVIPAGRKEYFIGKFKNGFRTEKDRIISENYLKKLKGTVVSPFVVIASIVGNENFRLTEIIPENLLRITLKKISANEILNEPLKLNPVYLRAVDVIFKKYDNGKN
jgi:tRNA threonylcarbamoyladenosine biosynthesis protein TsaB